VPKSIIKETLRKVTPLSSDQTVGVAATKVLEAGLPALPVVGPDGAFAGIFGEREFMKALFPGYVGELASAAVISRTIDETIERRNDCRNEPISAHLTDDHVLVAEEYSDTQLAEIFLHHRVLIIPVANDGEVDAVVTRNDFFRELVDRLLASTTGG
jgi:CBS domain-containing protein